VVSKQAPTFAETIHVRDTCVCLHVQRAARALARRFDDVLRPLGLTHGQFSMLNGLNRPRPATMTSMTALLAMDRTTLTAALKPLVRDRIVAVTVDPEDARGRLLALTPKGKALLARAIPIWRREHKTLDVREPDALRAVLATLR
jgi:DNA-binding MarR family transcriptional regulator